MNTKKSKSTAVRVLFLIGVASGIFSVCLTRSASEAVVEIKQRIDAPEPSEDDRKMNSLGLGFTRGHLDLASLFTGASTICLTALSFGTLRNTGKKAR